MLVFGLAETNAPPSIRLVQRLIFQFINSERLRQEECLTMHHLYQVTTRTLFSNKAQKVVCNKEQVVILVCVQVINSSTSQECNY